jgi:hypothetical protein
MDMTQLKVAFCNFEKASKNSKAKLVLTEQFWPFIYWGEGGRKEGNLVVKNV